VDWFEEWLDDLLTHEAFMGYRRYQGAYTGMLERGLFVVDIWHNDVKSMYPMIMVVLNLSPESVHFVSLKPYTGQYRFDFEAGIIEVPDKYLGQLTVRIDKEDSITRKFMLEFFGMRQKLRKGRSTPAKRSNQLAIKVIMNATYGYHGLEFSRYGSFLVAIVTTAVGRLIIDTILKLVHGVEFDTDGVYSTGDDVHDIINEKIQGMFKQYPLYKYLRVEVNHYAGMLVYRAKNYILLTDDNKLKIKGSAFHGRHMPPIVRTALNAFARAAFEKRPFRKVWKEFHDLRSFPISEFTMSVTLRKDPHGTEYGYDEHTMYHDLSSKLGDEVQWGQDVYYVKTKDGYTPVGTIDDKKLLRMIDRQYYRDRMRDVVKRLEWAVHGTKQIKVGRRKMITGKTKLHEFM